MTAEERLARIEAAAGNPNEIDHLVLEADARREGISIREWIRIRKKAHEALVTMAPLDLLAALERHNGHPASFVARAIHDKDVDEVLSAFQPLLATAPERVAAAVRDLTTAFSGRVELQRTQKIKHPQPLIPEALEVLSREPALAGMTGFNLDWARRWIRRYRPRDGTDAPAPPPRTPRAPSGIGMNRDLPSPSGPTRPPWRVWQDEHQELLAGCQPDPTQTLWTWDGHGVEIQNGELVWFSEAGHAAVQSFDAFVRDGRFTPPVPDDVLADLLTRLARA